MAVIRREGDRILERREQIAFLAPEPQLDRRRFRCPGRDIGAEPLPIARRAERFLARVYDQRIAVPVPDPRIRDEDEGNIVLFIWKKAEIADLQACDDRPILGGDGKGDGLIAIRVPPPVEGRVEGHRDRLGGPSGTRVQAQDQLRLGAMGRDQGGEGSGLGAGRERHRRVEVDHAGLVEAPDPQLQRAPVGKRPVGQFIHHRLGGEGQRCSVKVGFAADDRGGGKGEVVMRRGRVQPGWQIRDRFERQDAPVMAQGQTGAHRLGGGSQEQVIPRQDGGFDA